MASRILLAGLYCTTDYIFVIIYLEQCVQPCLFLINQTSVIRRGNINETSSFHHFNIPSLLSGNISTFDYHAHKKLLFWYDGTNKKIYSSNYKQYTGIISLNLRIGNVAGISVDWSHNILYWTDDVYNTISASGLQGEHQTIIQKGTYVKTPTLIVFAGVKR